MNEKYIQILGLTAMVLYSAFVVFLYAAEPRSLEEISIKAKNTLEDAVTKGQVVAGTYQIDEASLNAGLAAFRQEKFVSARDSFQKADPEKRDARTQFYVAYSFYRQGWGRVSNDDTLFKQSLDLVDRVAMLDRDYRSNDPNLQLRTPAELKAELEEGMQVTADDFNPLRLVAREKINMRETEIETRHVDGELIDATGAEDLAAAKASEIALVRPKAIVSNQRFAIRYIFLPLAFLTVAMLGGLRLAGTDASFIFLKPALLCLIFAAIMLALIFRSGLVRLDGWFAEDFSLLKNASNGAVLVCFFAATTQLFNSLIPEQGLPFWIVSFCFFWTLWNNLFADFDTKKLLRSLGALFGLAFVVKYLVLANLTAPVGDNWLRGLLENPTQEAFTWLLDLPRFSAGTGYIQFFVAGIYLVALFLFPATTRDTDQEL